MTAWKRVGNTDLSELARARPYAHWAAQVPASLGWGLVPAQRDFGHTTLRWNPRSRVLATEVVGQELLFSAGLRVSDLSVVILNGAGVVVATESLRGKTLQDAFRWLTEQVDARIGEDQTPTLGLAELDIGEHPLATGAPFDTSMQAGFTELDRWFENGAAIGGYVLRRDERASMVRCWPHHFDIATLITVKDHEDPQRAQSVGCGLSPGDDTYPHPYLYVTPWPYPAVRDDLPELAHGHWHTRGFVAAVLEAPEIIASSDQAQHVYEFIDSALGACEAIVRRNRDKVAI